MRIAPTLLRLILVLSLVLNGTGLAAAHASGAETVAAASAVVEVAPKDEAPCHEAPDPGDTRHERDAGKAEGDLANDGMIDRHSHTDCCDMDTCENACPQPLSAALVAAASTGVHARPASHPQTMPATPAGPRLPHPIRPPIA